MMIARWRIDARFGHKQQALDLLKKWAREIAPQIGWTGGKIRLTTGSIGALESTIESEVLVKDLAELNAAWDKLAGIPAHTSWGRELEPFIVSGTSRWEVLRVLQT
jgi:hypothetical protein